MVLAWDKGDFSNTTSDGERKPPYGPAEAGPSTLVRLEILIKENCIELSLQNAECQGLEGIS